MIDRMIRPNHGERHPASLGFVAVGEKLVDCCNRNGKQLVTFGNGAVVFLRMEKEQETRIVQADFKTPHPFWDLLANRVSRQRPLWIYCHDLPHTFTLLGGWQRWRQGTLGVKHDEVAWQETVDSHDEGYRKNGLIIDNDPPVVFDLWHQSGGRVVFVDTRNYWHSALPELPDPLATANHIREQVTGLWLEHKARKLGNWTYTAAGLGWNAWRHRFMEKAVFVHGDHVVDTFERSAYYGGWTAATYHGTVREPLVQIDINGLYPFVMARQRLPVELIRYTAKRDTAATVVQRCPQNCIATIEIDSPREPFPVRDKTGRTEMRVGRFVTTLAGPELYVAVSSRLVRSVIAAAEYRLDNLFADFVDYFWRLRVEGKRSNNAAAVSLAKAMLVGVYGRWARRTPRWKALSDETAMPENWTALSPTELAAWLQFTGSGAAQKVIVAGQTREESQTLRLVGRHWQLKQRSERHQDAFVAIAAFVTSYARELMRADICTAGERNVYRIATDSLIVNERGYDALLGAGRLDPERLGAYKVEACGKDAEFHSVHTFRLGEQWTRGGLSDEAETLPDGRLIDWKRDGLETLISSSYQSSFSRIPLAIHNAPGYNGAVSRDAVWLGWKSFHHHESEGAEHGQSNSGKTDPANPDSR